MIYFVSPFMEEDKVGFHILKLFDIYPRLVMHTSCS